MIEEILYLEKLCTSENRSNLNYFSLSVEKGTIHLATGTDSSGMSLLPEILAGNIQPSLGSVYYEGEEVRLHSRAQSERMGIFYISSDLAVIRELTVAENLSYKKPAGWNSLFLRKKENERRAQALFRKYGLNLETGLPVYRLTRAQSYELLICRAVLCGVRLLVCQEIGEGFSDYEVEEMRDFLLRLKEEGVSVLLLNANFESALGFADHISVIRDGMVCYSADVKEVSLYSVYKCLESHPDAEAGRQKAGMAKDRRPLLLELLFDRKGAIVSIKAGLVPGEITGIATGEAPAVGGEDLLYHILSGRVSVKGAVRQSGREIPIGRWLRKNRREICYLGVRFWESNVFSNLTVGENIVLSAVSRYGGHWSKALERLMLKEFSEKYGVELDWDSYPKQLATGDYNQLVLWRLLFYPPKYLVLANPMFGADEPLRERLLEALFVLQGRGTCILWSSNSEASLEKYCQKVYYPEFYFGERPV